MSMSGVTLMMECGEPVVMVGSDTGKAVRVPVESERYCLTMLILTMLLLAADPFAERDALAVVLVFTRADCPVSNRYAPEISRLEGEYAARGVRFWLVYPDRATTESQREAHRAEYGYHMPAIADPDQKLVARAAAVVTPEVAVFVPKGRGWQRVYRGRIDDRYVDFGKYRPTPERHDLAEALDSVLAGRPVEVRVTKSIGCAIADLR